MDTTFSEATRVSTGLLTSRERQCLLWLAARMPRWLNSDHLTGLALVAMFMTGVSYWLARGHRLALVSAVAWLAVNWFGDSLDGTLARVRHRQRPRYGFYVDHVLDTFGVLFLLGGLAASGYMNPSVAAGLLIAYYVLSIELYLATYCLGTFRMSFWKFGPTELRIVLSAGTLVLLFHPIATIQGKPYLLFDIGGLVAIAGLALTTIVSVVGHIRELYVAERLSAPAGEEA
jgi:archaetidylinositol phosphate synthase